MRLSRCGSLVAPLVALQEYAYSAIGREQGTGIRLVEEFFMSTEMPAVIFRAKFMIGASDLALGGGQVAALVQKVVRQNGDQAMFLAQYSDRDGGCACLGQKIIDNQTGILVLPAVGTEGFWFDKIYTEAWVVSHSWGGWEVARTPELVGQVRQFADDLEEAAQVGCRNNDLPAYVG